jgi:hypothetical protein
VDNIVWAAKNRHKENEEKYISRVDKPNTEKEISSFFPMMDKQLLLSKKIQYSIVFDLLTKGRQIIDFEGSMNLYYFLFEPSIPKKIWSNNYAWDMAKCIDAVLQEKVRSKLKNSPFISIILDEVKGNDNT